MIHTLNTTEMKKLRIIVALLILAGFTFSCTPQAINDENPTEISFTGGDTSDDTDDSRDYEDEDGDN